MKYFDIKYANYAIRMFLFAFVLFGDLLINPKHFGYWRTSHKNPRALIALPWFTFGALDWLLENIPENACVFEWGSGGSTLFLATRTAHLTSVEDDEVWYKRVSDEIAARELRVKSYRLLQGMEYVQAIRSFADKSFDVICIDGSNRNDCVREAMSKLKPNGILVLDNSERPEYADGMKLLQNWKRLDFQGPGMYNTYTWRTSVFLNLV